MNPHSWDIVGGTETKFEMSKILRPLAPVQKDILILGNLDNDGVSSHMDAPGTFMSATKHKIQTVIHLTNELQITSMARRLSSPYN